jgi:DnaK suppressor protein
MRRTLKEVDVTAAKKVAASSPRKAGPATRTASATKKAPTKASTKTVAKAKPAPAKKSATATKKPTLAGKTVKKTAQAPKKAESARAKADVADKKKVPATKGVSKKSAPAKAAAASVTAPAKKKAVATKSAPPPAPKRPTVGPYAKDAKFFEEQRALLLEERAIYSGQAVDLRAEADSLALEREPGDVQFDEESGEGGTVTVDRERNLALSAQASAAVEEIDDALRKIDRKSYGGCERCHQAIPKARLRALPFARLCVACKSGGLSRR